MGIGETELIDRCLAGEESAWREFVRRYERMVFSVSYRILKEPDEARDAAQESLLKAMRSLGSFQYGNKLKPWLSKIAWNHALRIAARRHKHLISFDENEPERVRSSLPDPLEVTERHEMGAAISAAIETLPPALQMVLELRHAEGMDYREISKATGWPIGTVKTNLFRGRQRLIEKLAAMEEEK